MTKWLLLFGTIVTVMILREIVALIKVIKSDRSDRAPAWVEGVIKTLTSFDRRLANQGHQTHDMHEALVGHRAIDSKGRFRWYNGETIDSLETLGRKLDEQTVAIVEAVERHSVEELETQKATIDEQTRAIVGALKENGK